MKPVVDGLRARYEGRVEFRVLNVERDAEANRLAASLGVTGVPTFFFVNSDGTQAGRIIGATTEQALTEAIEKLR